MGRGILGGKVGPKSPFPERLANGKRPMEKIMHCLEWRTLTIKIVPRTAKLR